MPDINRYWDLKDELYAVFEELLENGNSSSASYEKYKELIARRDAIYSELKDLEQQLGSIQFNHDDYEDTLEFDVMDDPDSIDEELDSDDYDDY